MFSAKLKMLPRLPTSRLRQLFLVKRFFCSDIVGGEHLVARFASWLSSCHDLRSLQKVHASAVTYGFEDNIFLGSKFLNCYAMLGNLHDSRLIFWKIINRNPSLWNSAIVGYFRSGHFEEVCNIFLSLKLRGIFVESGTLTFCLKSCTALRDCYFGKGVHAESLKINLSRDKYVGSSLVGFYSECGEIEDAQLVFDEILEKDVVAYTTMVTSYSQLVDCRCLRAFWVVVCMQKEGLDPNRVTLVSLIQAVAQVEAYKEGRAIHCYAVRRRIDISDEVLETCLIDMYLRCDSRNLALSVFSRMNKRSVASWNAMIAGLVRSGYSSEALGLFDLMKQEDNFPDEITLANVLLACNDLKYFHLATSIHACIIRKGIPLDLVLTTSLIETYAEHQEIEKVRILFDKLITRDVVCYNVIISAYLQNGLVDEAIKWNSKMADEDILPNSATLISFLSAFTSLANIRGGKCVHGYVLRHGFDLIVEISNQMLHMYAKCGLISISREIFNRIDRKDLVSWTSMVMGYVSSGQANEALVLFQLMQRSKVKPDSVTLLSLIQAVSHLRCIYKLKEIHGLCLRDHFNRNTSLLNSLIMTYSQCGRLDIGEKVFNSMSERGLASWNTMISTYGMHGYFSEAIDLFHQMQSQNVKPDDVTFTSLLSACSHVGRIEDGWSIFHSMNANYSVTPNEEHHACMVDLLARAGHLGEAFDLVKKFRLGKNVSALSSLLSACVTYGNTELGEVIGRKLIDLEPKNHSSYTLVSNIYAHGGNWNKAANFRDAARDKGLTKLPGYSLIELEK